MPDCSFFDVLDPCKIIKALVYMACTVVAFVMGGYGGKFLVIHQADGGDGTTFEDKLSDGSFLVPDLTFWISGFVVLVGLCAVGCLARLAVKALSWLLDGLCCTLPLWICGLDGRSRERKRNQEMGQAYFDKMMLLDDQTNPDV